MKSKKNKDKQETAEQHDELTTYQQECEAWKEKYLRVSADFDNFRRRMDKEQPRWMQAAQAQLAKDLLAVVDDFERALEQKEKQELASELKEWFSGFAMIGSSLEKILTKYGLSLITETKIFDPELHEAVMHVDSPDHEEGAIVQVLQKGYRFKEQVLRPAKVSVAK